MQSYRHRRICAAGGPVVTRIGGAPGSVCWLGSSSRLVAQGRVDLAEADTPGDDRTLTLRVTTRPRCLLRRGRGGSLMARSAVPEGWCVQAFRSRWTQPRTRPSAMRHFGAAARPTTGRSLLESRYEAWRATAVGNNRRATRCVSTPRSAVWCLRHAVSGGAVDAYSELAELPIRKRGGLPGSRKSTIRPRIHDRSRCVELDRRHLTLPVVAPSGTQNAD